MEPFKITDDFGSELTLFGARFAPKYGIVALSLGSHEIYREKEPELLSSEIKFALSITTDRAIHRLFYKTYKSASSAYKSLTEIAKQEDAR